jgi:hypothetical protein
MTMNKLAKFLFLFLFAAMFTLDDNTLLAEDPIVSIKGNEFLVDGVPTYQGRFWKGNKVEGLLLNARLVQGIFDDENPETRVLFKYPDTDKWDPDRNTDEFVAAMPLWNSYGLNSFTINLQGGSPTGYGNKNWKNTAFTETGELKPAYFDRLARILDKAEELKMIPVVGYFYFGQDQHLNDEAAIINAVDKATGWLLDNGYRNVLIEVNNESNVGAYDHEILKPARVHELINQVKAKSRNGHRLLVSTSFGGRYIPDENVVEASDFVLLHGNGVDDPEYIKEMVAKTKSLTSYRGQPIVFNEDDHYDYDQEANNFKFAIEAYASWGYFDFRRNGESDIKIGYQSVPVDWGIDQERKQKFFDYVKEISGY